MASAPSALPTASQTLPHSHNTLQSTSSPEVLSSTPTPAGPHLSSTGAIKPVSSTASPSPAPSSPASITPLLTSTLHDTTEQMDTGSTPVSTLTPSHTTGGQDTSVTSWISTGFHTNLTSLVTSVSNVEDSTSVPQTLPSNVTTSDLRETTTELRMHISTGDSTIATKTPTSAQTTEKFTQTASSRTTALTYSSKPGHTRSALDTTAGTSNATTSSSPEQSSTDFTSAPTQPPNLAPSTVSAHRTTGVEITSMSSSPYKTASAEITTTVYTRNPAVASQSTEAWDTSAMAPAPSTLPTASQTLPHSHSTLQSSSSPEVLSSTQTPVVPYLSSTPTGTKAAPSPAPSSPVTTTPLLTFTLQENTQLMDTVSTPVSTLIPSLSDATTRSSPEPSSAGFSFIPMLSSSLPPSTASPQTPTDSSSVPKTIFTVSGSSELPETPEERMPTTTAVTRVSTQIPTFSQTREMFTKTTSSSTLEDTTQEFAETTAEMSTPSTTGDTRGSTPAHSSAKTTEMDTQTASSRTQALTYTSTTEELSSALDTTAGISEDTTSSSPKLSSAGFFSSTPRLPPSLAPSTASPQTSTDSSSASRSKLTMSGTSELPETPAEDRTPSPAEITRDSTQIPTSSQTREMVTQTASSWTTALTHTSTSEEPSSVMDTTAGIYDATTSSSPELSTEGFSSAPRLSPTFAPSTVSDHTPTGRENSLISLSSYTTAPTEITSTVQNQGLVSASHSNQTQDSSSMAPAPSTLPTASQTPPHSHRTLQSSSSPEVLSSTQTPAGPQLSSIGVLTSSKPTASLSAHSSAPSITPLLTSTLHDTTEQMDTGSTPVSNLTSTQTTSGQDISATSWVSSGLHTSPTSSDTAVSTVEHSTSIPQTHFTISATSESPETTPEMRTSSTTGDTRGTTPGQSSAKTTEMDTQTDFSQTQTLSHSSTPAQPSSALDTTAGLSDTTTSFSPELPSSGFFSSTPLLPLSLAPSIALPQTPTDFSSVPQTMLTMSTSSGIPETPAEERTPSTSEVTRVSTQIPTSSQTTEISKTTSSSTLELIHSITPAQPSSALDTTAGHSDAATSSSSEHFRADFSVPTLSASLAPYTDSAQRTTSVKITSVPSSPYKTASAEITNTVHTQNSAAASHSSSPWDMLATAPATSTLPTASQTLPHSYTTLQSSSTPEVRSSTPTPDGPHLSSTGVLTPSKPTASLSAPSSAPSITPLLTSTLHDTTEQMDTGSTPVSNLTPSQTSGQDISATSWVSSGLHTSPTSSDTAVSTVEDTSSMPQTHFTLSATSKFPETTAEERMLSTTRVSTVSTQTPTSSQTREMATQTASSWTTALTHSSTPEEPSSHMDTIAGLSDTTTNSSPEQSSEGSVSSPPMLPPSLTPSTVSAHRTTEWEKSMISSSSYMPTFAEITTTIPTELPASASHSTHAWDTSATASATSPFPSASQTWPHSHSTLQSGSSPDVLSSTETPADPHLSGSGPLTPASSTASPSPAPSSSASITSLLTSTLQEITQLMDTRSTPASTLTPSQTTSGQHISATSQVSSGLHTSPTPSDTAVSTVEHSSSTLQTHFTISATSEFAETTAGMRTHSNTGDTTDSTPARSSAKTTEMDTQTASSRTQTPTYTSALEEPSSALDTTADLSKDTTRSSPELSSAGFFSSTPRLPPSLAPSTASPQTSTDSSSVLKTYFTTSASSELPETTAEERMPSTTEITRVSTQIPTSFQTREMFTETTSSSTLELTRSSTPTQPSSALATSAGLTGATTSSFLEFSSASFVSSAPALPPSHTPSTISAHLPTGMEITTVPSSSYKKTSAEITTIHQKQTLASAAHGTQAQDTPATAPTTSILPTASQTRPHSHTTLQSTSSPQVLPSTQSRPVPYLSSTGAFIPTGTTASHSPSPSSPAPITPLLTSTLQEKTQLMDTGSTPVSTLTPSQTARGQDTPATSGIHTSPAASDTAVTTVEDSTSVPQTHFTLLVSSEVPLTTAKERPPSSPGVITASTQIPSFSQTREMATQTESSWTTALTHTSTPEEPSSSMDITAGLSDATTSSFPELSSTGFFSAPKLPPSLTPSTVMTHRTTEMEKSVVSSSSYMPAFPEITTTMPIQLLASASNSTRAWDSSTTASATKNLPTAAQTLPHSHSTLQSSSFPDVLTSTPTPAGPHLSSTGVLTPGSSTASASPAPSSPVSITSLLTSALQKTMQWMDAGSTYVSTLTSTQTTGGQDVSTNTWASLGLHSNPTSSDTAESTVEHSSSIPQIQFTLSATSEPPEITAEERMLSTTGVSTVSTQMPTSSQTREMATQTASSWTTALTHTSTPEEPSSNMDTTAGLSDATTSSSPEQSNSPSPAPSSPETITPLLTSTLHDTTQGMHTGPTPVSTLTKRQMTNGQNISSASWISSGLHKSPASSDSTVSTLEHSSSVPKIHFTPSASSELPVTTTEERTPSTPGVITVSTQIPTSTKTREMATQTASSWTTALTQTSTPEEPSSNMDTIAGLSDATTSSSPAQSSTGFFSAPTLPPSIPPSTVMAHRTTEWVKSVISSSSYMPALAETTTTISTQFPASASHSTHAWDTAAMASATSILPTASQTLPHSHSTLQSSSSPEVLSSTPTPAVSHLSSTLVGPTDSPSPAPSSPGTITPLLTSTLHDTTQGMHTGPTPVSTLTKRQMTNGQNISSASWISSGLHKSPASSDTTVSTLEDSSSVPKIHFTPLASSELPVTTTEERMPSTPGVITVSTQIPTSSQTREMATQTASSGTATLTHISTPEEPSSALVTTGGLSDATTSSSLELSSADFSSAPMLPPSLTLSTVTTHRTTGLEITSISSSPYKTASAEITTTVHTRIPASASHSTGTWDSSALAPATSILPTASQTLPHSHSTLQSSSSPEVLSSTQTPAGPHLTSTELLTPASPTASTSPAPSSPESMNPLLTSTLYDNRKDMETGSTPTREMATQTASSWTTALTHTSTPEEPSSHMDTTAGLSDATTSSSPEQSSTGFSSAPTLPPSIPPSTVMTRRTTEWEITTTIPTELSESASHSTHVWDTSAMASATSIIPTASQTLAHSLNTLQSSSSLEVLSSTQTPAGPHLSSTGQDISATSWVSSGLHTSPTYSDTAVSTLEDSSSVHKIHFTTAASSELPVTTAEKRMPSTPGVSTVSTQIPTSSQTRVMATQTASSWTTELIHISTPEEPSSHMDTTAGLSDAATSSSPELSTAGSVSSALTLPPSLTLSTVSAHRTTGVEIASLSSTPYKTASAEITTTIYTQIPESASHSAHAWDMSAKAPATSILPTTSHTLPHSHSTLQSSSSPAVLSSTQTAPVPHLSSTITLTTSGPTASTSPAPSSPAYITQLLTSTLHDTTQGMDTGSTPVSTWTASHTRNGQHISDTSWVSSGLRTSPTSSDTAVTTVEYSSSVPQTYFTTSASSELPVTTAEERMPSTTGVITVSTQIPTSTKTREMATQTASSWTTALTHSSTPEEPSSNMDTTAGIYDASTILFPEQSSAGFFSSAPTLPPSIPPSTVMAHRTTEWEKSVISSSSYMPALAEITTTISTQLLASASHSTHAWDTSALASATSILPTASQTLPHSHSTLQSSSSPEVLSSTQTPAGPHLSSTWTLTPAGPTASPSPASASPSSFTPFISTLQDTTRGMDTESTPFTPQSVSVQETSSLSSLPFLSSSSSFSVTSSQNLSPLSSSASSLLTSGLSKTTHISNRSPTWAASSPPSLTTSALETPAPSDVTTGTEKPQSSSHPAVSKVPTRHSEGALSSRLPISWESPTTAYAVGSSARVWEVWKATPVSDHEAPTGVTTEPFEEASMSTEPSSAPRTPLPPSLESTPALQTSQQASTSSTPTSASGWTPVSQSTVMSRPSVPHFYTPPSVMVPSGVTSSPPPSQSTVSASQSVHVPRTNLMPSESTGPNPSTPLSENTMSFVTPGVPQASLASPSASPYSRMESSPGQALPSAIAENWPSSASVPASSSDLSTPASPTSPTLHAMTSSPATTNMADTSLATEGHPVTPKPDEDTLEHNTKMPNKAEHKGTRRPGTDALTSPAHPKELSEGETGRRETTPTTPEATPTAPETTPVTPEITPTPTETTPAAPGARPTMPKTVPMTPEATPTAPEATPTPPDSSSRTPETTPTMLEATPTTPKSVPTMPEITPTTPETMPAMPHTTPMTLETTPTMPEITPMMPETTPAMLKTTPTMSEITPMVPETIPTMPETTPTAPKTTPMMPETTPTTPETMPTTPETMSALSDTTPMMLEAMPTKPGFTPTTPEATPMMPETMPTAPKTTPMMSETTPTAPKTTPMMPETTPTTPETMPTTPETMSALSDTTPMIPEATPTKPGVTPTTPETTPMMPETTPMMPETTPTTPETMPTTPETMSALSDTTPMMPETTPTKPGVMPTTPETMPMMPKTTPMMLETTSVIDESTLRVSAPPVLRTPGQMASTSTASTTTPAISEVTDLSILRSTTESRPAGPAPSIFPDVPELETSQPINTWADTNMPNDSPNTAGVTDSPVTHSGPQTSNSAATPTVSSAGPRWATSVGMGAETTHPDIPTVMISSAESGTMVTHPTDTQTPVSRTISTLTHGVWDTTTLFMDTRTEAKASSAIPTSVAISPDTPELVTSALTGFEADTRTTSSTPTPSARESESPASGATAPGTQVAATSSNPTVSPGVAGLVTSQVTHPELEMATTTALTLTVLPGASEMVTALTTHSETHTRQSPTWIVSSGPLETTTSQVTSHPGSQASSAIPVITRESYSTASFITQPSEASPAVATTSPSLPHRESDASPSTVTSISEEASSVPVTRISPGEPDTGTSLEAISTGNPTTTASSITPTGGQASTAIPTLTVFPEVSATATLAITSSKEVTSPPMPTLAVSPSESNATASLITSVGAQTNSAIPTLTVPPKVSEMATTLVTSSGTEASSFPTGTFPSGPSETTESRWVTHLGPEASSAVPTVTVPSTMQNTTTSLVTRSTETSSAALGMSSSLSHSESDTPTTKPPLTPFPVESETTTLLVTQTISVIPTLTVSPSVTEKITSVVSGPGAKMSTVTLMPTVSPPQSETTAMWVVTHPESQASSSAPSQSIPPERTNTWTTHLTETSPIISRTTPYFSHSGSDTPPSMTTSPGMDTSSDVSPKAPGVVTLLITSSRAVTSLSTSSLTLPSAVTETTASSVTPTEAQTGWIRYHTHNGYQFWNRNKFSHSDNYLTGSTTSLITHPSETSSIVTPTAPHFSHSSLLTTTSVATSSGTEATSGTPTMSSSSEEPDRLTSQVLTTSGQSTSMPAPTMTLSTSQSETTNLSTASPRAVSTSSKFPSLSMFPHTSETTASLPITPWAKVSTAIPTQTVPPGGPETATSVLTTETSRIDRGSTVSPHVPTPTTSLSTHPGSEVSTGLPSVTMSPGLSQTTGLWVTSPLAETSSEVLTMAFSLHVPSITSESNTVTSWTPETSPVTTVRTPDFSKMTTGPMMIHTLSETSTLPATSHEEGSSPSTIQKTTTSETTNSATTGSRPTVARTTSTPIGPLSGSPFVPLTTTAMTILTSEMVTSRTSKNNYLLTVVPDLVPFTLNFTITNLGFEKNMEHPGSWKFNTTERVLQYLLKPLLKNSSLGSLYSGCRLVSLRPEKNGAATRVNAICTHHPGPAGFRLDRKKLYWELSQLTYGITQLGPYTLDTDSLYVNGFTHQSSALTTSPPGTSTAPPGTSGTPSSFPSLSTTAPGLFPFTLNFTIVNLQYTPDMKHPGSAKFNTTEVILQRMLGPVFANTNIGPQFSGCQLTSLRPEKDGSATTVNMICTLRSKPASTGLDRERLYWELSHETKGISRLDTYTLDRNSLYVNGYNHRHRVLTSTPSTAIASTLMPTTSATTALGPTATGPNLVPFTLNFTITNLEYEQDMGHPGTGKFNVTEGILQRLLRPLFEKTSVGPLYSECRLDLLRSEKEGAATGVDAICTYHPYPMGPGLDRERLYKELSQLTLGISQLGPYSLDQDSLYVNGFTLHSLPSTPRSEFPRVQTSSRCLSPNPTAAAGPILVPFTLNFTITNLKYEENMGHPGSGKFNVTQRILQRLLRPLFKKTSIGPLYSDCRLDQLRSEKEGAATGVDAICTHLPDTMGPGLDRKQLYRELSQLTFGISQLGPYSLDQDSFYVNGYTLHTLPSTPRIAGPILVPFTLNFTITNLEYEKDMGHPGSWKFNVTERILQRLLRPLFKKTSVGPLYSDCRLDQLRSEKEGAATGVDAICTHRPYPKGPGLDREWLYRELSQLTLGISQLGSYSLDKDSLYVNGYTLHSLPSTPRKEKPCSGVQSTNKLMVSSPNPTAAAAPMLVPFTLNFTITNLKYEENMGHPGSGKFNVTQRILQRLLRPLFKKTSVGPLYSDCRLDQLRSEKEGTATGVDAICTYRPKPTGPGLDREQLYRELSQLTLGITQLGPYSLDQDSLYVNGYTLHSLPSTPSKSPPQILNNIEEKPCSGAQNKNKLMVSSLNPTAAAAPMVVPFTLNFTITNLKYEENMGHPGSGKFNVTERILQRLVRAPSTVHCTVHTAMTTPAMPNPLHSDPCSRKPVLGPSTLIADWTSSAAAPMVVPFTLNFTITNLKYEENMGHPGSGKFNVTERILQRLLRPLFKKTSVGPLYSDCRLDHLRSKQDGTATGVDAICTLRPDPTGPGLDREQLYKELSQLTLGISQLGHYSLDQDSLYVNGFTLHSLPSTSSMTIMSSAMPGPSFSPTAAGPMLVPFTLNFTITNLGYKEEMGHPGSQKFNVTERILQRLLRPLFKKTSVGPLYFDCRLDLLRPEKKGTATAVDAICSHSPDTTGPGLERERLYRELSQLTTRVTQLGSFTLDPDSLYVNGYTHQAAVTTPSSKPCLSPVSITGLTQCGFSFFSSAAATGPVLLSFTLNFTITNLRYKEDMQEPGSGKFNTTERVLQGLLGRLFHNTSVGPLFSGCRLDLLRSEKKGAATRVDAICSHHPNPTGPGLDRERLYRELSQMTLGITQLGPYSLDQDSLYVNGYTLHSLPSTPRTSMVVTVSPARSTSASHPTAVSPALVPFTLNFTITNLQYKEDLGQPGSAKFNTTERILQRLLRSMFKKTTIGPLYSDCRLDLLRPKNEGTATGVDAICTQHSDPTGLRLDRERLYRELSQLTLGVTQLGTYSLDQNSLYVNGEQCLLSIPALYTTHPPTTKAAFLPSTPSKSSSPSPAATGPVLLSFTLNFTITNLRYQEDMQEPGSGKFNTTERVLQGLLGPLFHNTSVGPLFSGCRLNLLRSEKEGAATGVDAICSHHPNPTGPGLDRERLYRELSQMTLGITQLGPYSLDQDSLYVNGEQRPSVLGCVRVLGLPFVPPVPSFPPPHPLFSLPAVSPALVPFTLNFTITNLQYKEDLGQPGSAKFNTTERILQRLLGPLFHNTSVGPLFSGCRLDLLRSEKEGSATGVDAICTHRPNPTGPGLDREQLYREFSQLTLGITQLGPYSLDQDSLYVNGFSLGAAVPTTTTGEISEELFTVNFTIANLRYSADMGHPDSVKFNITDALMVHLLSPLFQKSSLGPRYTGCRVTTLRSVNNGAQTQVDMVCAYRKAPGSLELPAKLVFQELSWHTRGITRLGPYLLDKDSLYLNGYNEPGPDKPPTTLEPATTILPSPATSVQPESTTATSSSLTTFTLNFTITNLPFSEDLSTGSTMFNATERILQRLLESLFWNSSLGPVYSHCRLNALRPEKDGAATSVNAICAYHHDPVGPGLNIQQLYQELSQMTHNATQLGSYTLDQHSLHVNGYTQQVTIIASVEMPTGSPSSENFHLNFTITNLPYSQDIAQPGTALHRHSKRSIEHALNAVFRNSSIKSYFSDCQVLAFRPVSHSNHTGVDSLCGFSPLARKVYRVAIYEEFLRMTQNGTQLQNFTLDRNSILVDGYSAIRNDLVTKQAGLPFWAIILICLAGLLGLISCLICCFLVTICRRKREGDYQVQRHRLGYYLPHLDLRKLQ
ncbi:PREDICTED: mucin-16 [Dipodomys ordii]|uniref:Mucin-16 n=1 Tax=Dipodomys ordii TaxID=10020 RepID=A0A1S3GL38_DIPOR|nr:PREDICTED: mucin-16 [Dipodomys ordii]